jgi:hypothetical protein
MVHQTVLFFVPGYMTGTSTQSYDEIVVRAARERNWGVEYMAMPNNNSGDVGNTTMDHCLEYIIRRYNMLEKLKAYADADIVLAGHAMGGLLVLRLMSDEVGHRLHRKPVCVRVLNPIITPIITTPLRVVSTILSFFPSIVRLLSLPVPVASPGELYPDSPDFSPSVKQVLSLSLMRHTGSLYLHNTTWDLMPFKNARNLITVFHNIDDNLSDINGSREYCMDNRVPLIEIDSRYHEYFEDNVIDRIYSLPE